MTRTDASKRHYVMLYMPLELRERMEQISKRERRSLSNAIVYRLEQVLAQDERDGETLARAS